MWTRYVRHRTNPNKIMEFLGDVDGGGIKLSDGRTHNPEVWENYLDELPGSDSRGNAEEVSGGWLDASGSNTDSQEADSGRDVEPEPKPKHKRSSRSRDSVLEIRE